MNPTPNSQHPTSRNSSLGLLNTSISPKQHHLQSTSTRSRPRDLTPSREALIAKLHGVDDKKADTKARPKLQLQSTFAPVTITTPSSNDLFSMEDTDAIEGADDGWGCDSPSSILSGLGGNERISDGSDSKKSNVTDGDHFSWEDDMGISTQTSNSSEPTRNASPMEHIESVAEPKKPIPESNPITSHGEELSHTEVGIPSTNTDFSAMIEDNGSGEDLWGDDSLDLGDDSDDNDSEQKQEIEDRIEEESQVKRDINKDVEFSAAPSVSTEITQGNNPNVVHSQSTLLPEGGDADLELDWAATLSPIAMHNEESNVLLSDHTADNITTFQPNALHTKMSENVFNDNDINSNEQTRQNHIDQDEYTVAPFSSNNQLGDIFNSGNMDYNERQDPMIDSEEVGGLETTNTTAWGWEDDTDLLSNETDNLFSKEKSDHKQFESSSQSTTQYGGVDSTEVEHTEERGNAGSAFEINNPVMIHEDVSNMFLQTSHSFEDSHLKLISNEDSSTSYHAQHDNVQRTQSQNGSDLVKDASDSNSISAGHNIVFDTGATGIFEENMPNKQSLSIPHVKKDQFVSFTNDQILNKEETYSVDHGAHKSLPFTQPGSVAAENHQESDALSKSDGPGDSFFPLTQNSGYLAENEAKSQDFGMHDGSASVVSFNGTMSSAGATFGGSDGDQSENSLRFSDVGTVSETICSSSVGTAGGSDFPPRSLASDGQRPPSSVGVGEHDNDEDDDYDDTDRQSSRGDETEQHQSHSYQFQTMNNHHQSHESNPFDNPPPLMSPPPNTIVYGVNESTELYSGESNTNMQTFPRKAIKTSGHDDHSQSDVSSLFGPSPDIPNPFSEQSTQFHNTSNPTDTSNPFDTGNPQGDVSDLFATSPVAAAFGGFSSHQDEYNTSHNSQQHQEQSQYSNEYANQNSPPNLNYNSIEPYNHQEKNSSDFFSSSSNISLEQNADRHNDHEQNVHGMTQNTYEFGAQSSPNNYFNSGDHHFVERHENVIDSNSEHVLTNVAQEVYNNEVTPMDPTYSTPTQFDSGVQNSFQASNLSHEDGQNLNLGGRDDDTLQNDVNKEVVFADSVENTSIQSLASQEQDFRQTADNDNFNSDGGRSFQESLTFEQVKNDSLFNNSSDQVDFFSTSQSSSTPHHEIEGNQHSQHSHEYQHQYYDYNQKQQSEFQGYQQDQYQYTQSDYSDYNQGEYQQQQNDFHNFHLDQPQEKHNEFHHHGETNHQQLYQQTSSIYEYGQEYSEQDYNGNIQQHQYTLDHQSQSNISDVYDSENSHVANAYHSSSVAGSGAIQPNNTYINHNDRYDNQFRGSTQIPQNDSRPSLNSHHAFRTSNRYKDPTFQPPSCLVAFGFGGNAFTMFPKRKLQLNRSRRQQQISQPDELRKGPIGIYRMEQLHPVCDNDRKNMESFPGPLSVENTTDETIIAHLDEVANSLSTDSEDERILLGVIKVLVKCKGKLRRDSNTPDSDDIRPDVQLLSLLKESQNNRSASCPLPNQQQQLHSVGKSQEYAGRIRDLLLIGDRKKAVDVAIRAQMWPEAMLIASFTGREEYKRVLTSYLSVRYNPGDPCRSLYLMFADQMEKSVHEPIPLNATQSSSIESPILDNWVSHAQMILANRTSDTNKVLRALGDRLFNEQKNVMAAHVCYLLGGVTVEAPTVQSKIALLGADHRSPKEARFYVSPSAVQRTEIYEWVLKKFQNTPTAENSINLVPFQGYKLIYAMMLADHGKLETAFAYVTSMLSIIQNVLSTLKPGQSMYIEGMQNQLAVLDDRLRQHLGQDRVEYTIASATKSTKGKWGIGGALNLMGRIVNRVVEGNDAPLPSPQEQPTMHHQHSSGHALGAQESMQMYPSASSHQINNSTSGSSHSQPSAGSDLYQNPSLTSHRSAYENIPPPVQESQHSQHQFQNNHQSMPYPPPEPMNTQQSQLSYESDNLHPNHFANHFSQDPMKQETLPPPPSPPVVENNSPKSNSTHSPTEPSNVATKQSPQNKPKKNNSKTVPSTGTTKSSGWGFSLSTFLTNKLVPTGDAKVAKMGEKMEAYFDKELNKWVFPGEEATEEETIPSAPPIGPIPTSSPNNPTSSTLGPSSTPDDPLAALMAPPQMRAHAAALMQKDPLTAMMAPPSRPGTYGRPFPKPKPKRAPRPAFAVFKPKPGQETPTPSENGDDN